MDIEKVIDYWVTSAERKWETTQALFEKKRSVDCLFFCHITIEMLLKGLVAKNTGEQAPPIHDLVLLAKKSGIELSEDDWRFLKEMSAFNMEARYPEERDKFYRLATEEFTYGYFEKTNKFSLWLKNLLVNNQ